MVQTGAVPDEHLEIIIITLVVFMRERHGYHIALWDTS